MTKAIIFDCYGVLVSGATHQINHELFAYIRQELKPKYKLGLLSNMAASKFATLFPPQDVALFDATALSSETGFVKPDPRAYHAIAERLGVEPAECALVDDQEGHCMAAIDEGMRALRYESFEQLSGALERMLK
jgi:FMN phosphatase YigB (HAD superfamily)